MRFASRSGSRLFLIDCRRLVASHWFLPINNWVNIQNLENILQYCIQYTIYIYIFIYIVSDLRIHLIRGHDGLQRGCNQPLCGLICQQHMSTTSPLPKLQPVCSCCESCDFYFLSQCHRPRRMISIPSICVMSLVFFFSGDGLPHYYDDYHYISFGDSLKPMVQLVLVVFTLNYTAMLLGMLFTFLASCSQCYNLCVSPNSQLILFPFHIRQPPSKHGKK